MVINDMECETWNVGWIFKESGNLSLTAMGLIIFSFQKDQYIEEPTYWTRLAAGSPRRRAKPSVQAGNLGAGVDPQGVDFGELWKLEQRLRLSTLCGTGEDFPGQREQ